MRNTLVALFLGALLAVAASAQLTGNIVVNKVLNGGMSPLLPATWIFGFKTDDGDLFTDFEVDHEKSMHLIAVSSDLDSFAHVHPEFRMASGLFRIRVNDWNDDPDNQDALHAVRRPGPYFLFSEVKPWQRPQLESRYTVVAEGEHQPRSLTLDPVLPDGSVRKYFDDLGQPGSAGDFYRVTLKARSMDHGGTPMLHFRLALDHTHDHNEGYEPIHDLEPWLGMPGHSILISQAGETVDQKVFRHMHARHSHGGSRGSHGGHGEGDHDHGSSDGVLKFHLKGAQVPPAGTYKLWFQVKHHQAIMTFPFVVELGR